MAARILWTLTALVSTSGALYVLYDTVAAMFAVTPYHGLPLTILLAGSAFTIAGLILCGLVIFLIDVWRRNIN